MRASFTLRRSWAALLPSLVLLLTTQKCFQRTQQPYKCEIENRTKRTGPIKRLYKCFKVIAGVIVLEGGRVLLLLLP